MPEPEADVIDTLAGIQPGSPLAAIRAGRAVARAEAEASYRALFEPADPGEASAEERFALGSFVAGLHGAAEASAFYAAGLARCGAPAALRSAVAAAIAAAQATGPYGRFPPGPLSREDTPGPVFRLDAAARAALGARLTAAFEHAHMLVFHPRDASAEALAALLAAGWSTTGIVTLSQLVAFLSFQIRVVAGLRTLARHL